MKFELEMLSVGCADAIILRYIILDIVEYVIVIDAGNKGDGLKVMEQIRKYTTKKSIDLAINTHPDSDHIGGFFDIVGKMKIDKFWIHDPSKHVDYGDVKKSVNEAKLKRDLRYITESLSNSENLLTLIDKSGIQREEPFAGKTLPGTPLRIVGPTVEYYEELLKNFRDVEHLFKQEALLERSHKLLTLNLETESLSETLDEKNDQSYENASSAMVLFTIEQKKFLFTADATPEAQMRASKFADLSNLYFLDVPHHGSKYNLTTELVRLYKPQIAIVSADQSKKYPSKAVVNALKKVGAKVYCTADGSKHDRHNMDGRLGYSEAKEI